MNPLLFLFGCDTLFVKAEDRTKIINFCLYENISYRDFECDEEGNVTFRCSRRDAKKLMRKCAEYGVSIARIATYGLPSILWRYRHRAGMLIGSLIGLALVIWAQLYVWDVQVVGNTSMTESEVRQELKECGFGVGSYIPDLHTSELENRILIASDRISWISIYLNGTVATVQVIEHTVPVEEESVKKPANVIATADGQIELIELYRGNIAVKVGQAVKKGDLLIGGIYGDETERIRYTRAAGKVMARTERKFCVEIPLQYEEKVYQKPKCGEIILNFFDFSTKIFKNTGNSMQAYDIIYKDYIPFSFFSRPLPFGWTVASYLPYTVQDVSRSTEEASVLAYAELENALCSLSEDIQLLSKNIKVTMTDTTFCLECTVECIEDIAMQSEFEIEELP